MFDGQPGEPSQTVRARAVAARERQLTRQGTPNSELAGRAIETHCPLDDEARTLLRDAMQKLGWSARAYFRVLKVARTIADLDGAEVLTAGHVAEAISTGACCEPPRKNDEARKRGPRHFQLPLKPVAPPVAVAVPRSAAGRRGSRAASAHPVEAPDGRDTWFAGGRRQASGFSIDS
jgi:hypothetical protein